MNDVTKTLFDLTLIFHFKIFDLMRHITGNADKQKLNDEGWTPLRSCFMRNVFVLVPVKRWKARNGLPVECDRKMHLQPLPYFATDTLIQAFPISEVRFTNESYFVLWREKLSSYQSPEDIRGKSITSRKSLWDLIAKTIPVATIKHKQN